jgi:C-terminal processing protease CtpA/Prc
MAVSTGRFKMIKSLVPRLLRLAGSCFILVITVQAGWAEEPDQRPVAGTGAASSSRSEPGIWGFVGVYLGDTTAEQARRLGLGELYGVIVGTVEKGSPAAGAGLQPGDCLLTLDGERILNRLQFFQAMMNTPPGKRIRLELLRKGERTDVELEVGRRFSQALLQRRRLFSEPDSMVRLAEENRRMAEEARAKGDEKGAARLFETETTLRQMAEDSRAYIENELREGRISEPVAVQNFNLNLRLSAKRYSLGVTAVGLTSQLASFFNAGEGGLLITEVRPGSAAAAAGLRSGDCLISLNSVAVRTPAELNQSIDRAVIAAPGSGPAELTLTVVRERTIQELRLRL